MATPRRGSQRTAKSIKSGETVPESIPKLSSFDWRDFLNRNPSIEGVPFYFFDHVPLAREFRGIVAQPYLKIQVELREEECPEHPCVKGKQVYWIATPKKYFGLMALIKYELTMDGNINRDELYMRYVNFMTDAKSIYYTKIRMDNSVTCYPKTFRYDWNAQEGNENVNWADINLHLNQWRSNSFSPLLTTRGELNGKYESDFTVGQIVETLDKSCISQMRVAEVIKLVGGRVHLRYWDSTAEPGEADFVCHERSQSVFLSGWCHMVGHDLSAPSGYASPTISDEKMKTYINYNRLPLRNIREGMWLEIVDPLNPSVIAAAQISKVLCYGYVMVEINRRNFSTTKCFHLTSFQLLYCGFCERFGLPLVKPIGYKSSSAQFCWKKFLEEVDGTELILEEFHGQDEAVYDVKKDMKLEAVDLMEPSHVCVATVSDVKGRLVRINFDGWEEKFDQWMVINSTDMFPMGWCEAYDYPLRPPRVV